MGSVMHDHNLLEPRYELADLGQNVSVAPPPLQKAYIPRVPNLCTTHVPACRATLADGRSPILSRILWVDCEYQRLGVVLSHHSGIQDSATTCVGPKFDQQVRLLPPNQRRKLKGVAGILLNSNPEPTGVRKQGQVLEDQVVAVEDVVERQGLAVHLQGGVCHGHPPRVRPRSQTQLPKPCHGLKAKILQVLRRLLPRSRWRRAVFWGGPHRLCRRLQELARLRLGSRSAQQLQIILQHLRAQLRGTCVHA
mmetsp:Transcript_34217/g.97210  ORF Transcript_34217/g.97210 Transcript_34217/m.97210 type:complete len:251 (+) Transcript_34217:338-1090(+)